MTDIAALQDTLRDMLLAGRRAYPMLARANRAIKDAVLNSLSEALRAHISEILEANQLDQAYARELGLSAAMIDRMALDEKRIHAIANSVIEIASLNDPVGEVIAEMRPKNGLRIERVRVPLGLIAVIYESRPNVTIDAASLCFKSGNAVMLRGGKEAQHSNAIFCQLFQDCLRKHGMATELVQRVPDQDRALVGYLLKAHGLVDVIVPRGGKNLVVRVLEEARVPVFAHLDGIVHVYVDHEVDHDLAVEVVANAKMRRTSICGAAECLLIHQDTPKETIKAILAKLFALGCEVRGDDFIHPLDNRIIAVQENDYGQEFSAPIIAIKTVKDQAEAEAHIACYGSNHTDVILTRNAHAAEQFFAHVDSAIIMHNASSQFADGGEFGMGAEIGIATGRMHARGPVGLEQLTTFHYRVHGHGETRPL